MIIGHEKIVSFFDDAINRGALAHAYCLVGPAGVGKRKVAEIVAAKLLNIPEEKLHTHTDYVFLGRESDEKTGKLKKDISIAQTRELRRRLQNSSWLGGYQVAVIDEAELLNAESGNALLKMIEEPVAKSLLFLLTTNDRAMLPTIRSRCQFFYLPTVSEEKIKNALVSLGKSESEAKAAADLSWGRPGRALRALQDLTESENFYKETERWKKLQSKNYYEKLAILEDIFGDKSDHIRERENIREALDIWTVQTREEMLASAGAEAWRLARLIDSLQDAKEKMAQNIHPKLLLENTILN